MRSRAAKTTGTLFLKVASSITVVILTVSCSRDGEIEGNGGRGQSVRTKPVATETGSAIGKSELPNLNPELEALLRRLDSPSSEEQRAAAVELQKLTLANPESVAPAANLIAGRVQSFPDRDVRARLYTCLARLMPWSDQSVIALREGLEREDDEMKLVLACSIADTTMVPKGAESSLRHAFLIHRPAVFDAAFLNLLAFLRHPKDVWRERAAIRLSFLQPRAYWPDEINRLLQPYQERIVTALLDQLKREAARATGNRAIGPETGLSGTEQEDTEDIGWEAASVAGSVVAALAANENVLRRPEVANSVIDVSRNITQAVFRSEAVEPLGKLAGQYPDARATLLDWMRAPEPEIRAAASNVLIRVTY